MFKTFQTSHIPDLAGKVAIVTGANIGLGLVTARELARKNAHVFVACRNDERGQAAVEQVKADTGNANVEFLKLDLGNLQNVKKAAEVFLARNLPLHILVNNAGIMATPYELTSDGIEQQFAVNYVGHFLFTTLLLPRIETSAPARIVNLSSLMHRSAPKGGIAFDNINLPDESPWTRYGQSKTATILFTIALDKRLQGKQIYVNAIHPGAVKTNLTSNLTKTYGTWIVPFVWIGRALRGISVEEGALTQLYAATSPEIEEKNYRGKYFVPTAQLGEAQSHATDEETAEKLWTFTENLIKEKTTD